MLAPIFHLIVTELLNWVSLVHPTSNRSNFVNLNASSCWCKVEANAEVHTGQSTAISRVKVALDILQKAYPKLL